MSCIYSKALRKFLYFIHQEFRQLFENFSIEKKKKSLCALSDRDPLKPTPLYNVGWDCQLSFKDDKIVPDPIRPDPTRSDPTRIVVIKLLSLYLTRPITGGKLDFLTMNKISYCYVLAIYSYDGPSIHTNILLVNFWLRWH